MVRRLESMTCSILVNRSVRKMEVLCGSLILETASRKILNIRLLTLAVNGLLET